MWHPTNYIVNEGLKFLENRDQTCPFFLTVSFYAPHPPYMFRKCEPYEGSARIPFIISGGDSLGLQSGQLFDGPVCLEDLMPTLLDLAGVGVPNGLDGHSLVSILRGEQTYWRPFLHGEHAPCYSQEQANHYLVDQTTKYIWRPLSGDEQLFDLAKDPNECNNLALRPDHLNRLCLWRGTLIERLADRPEGFTDGERLIVGRDYPGIFPHIQQDR